LPAEGVEIIAAEPQKSAYPQHRNNRRGPNRRRPRNPNYKKPEIDFSLGLHEQTAEVEKKPTHSAEEHVVLLPLSHPEPQTTTTKLPYAHEFAQRLEKVEKKSLENAIHEEIVKHKEESHHVTTVEEVIHHETIKPLKVEEQKIEVLKVTKNHEVVIEKVVESQKDDSLPLL
jgi:hypothetical protein